MINYLRYIIVILFKSISFYTPLKRYVFYRYPYNFEPTQLIFLCSCIDKTKDLKEPIVEIGCDSGNTTVFLNKHMDFSGIEKSYICIDTFSGFTKNDINYEASYRGKEKKKLDGFRVNNKKWFDETIRSNGISRVKAFKTDISQFEFQEIKGISFCLIDVDLYIPVKTALNKAYSLTVKGGIIIVDDCKPNQLFDGAYKAYMEFIETHQLPKKILLDKLGVIEIRKD